MSMRLIQPGRIAERWICMNDFDSKCDYWPPDSEPDPDGRARSRKLKRVKLGNSKLRTGN